MSTFLAYLFTQLRTMSRALLKTSLVGWLPSSNIIIIVIIRLTTPLTRKSQRIRPLKFDKTTQKPNKMREATLRNHHARYEARQPVCNIPQELQKHFSWWLNSRHYSRKIKTAPVQASCSTFYGDKVVPLFLQRVSSAISWLSPAWF